MSNELLRQTRGYLLVNIIYDVDFDDMESLRASLDGDHLIRLDSENVMVQSWDTANAPASLMGLTIRGQDYNAKAANKGTDVFLVADRLYVRDVFERVAMHEVLHVFGCTHTNFDDRSIMYPATAPPGMPIRLRGEDYGEICRVYGCNVDRISQ